jgi:hypothetical protein
VSRDTAAAREVVVSSKNGFPWQASVGHERRGVRVRQGTPAGDGQRSQYSGPLNVVRKATLGEISFVDLGADGATSASVAAVPTLLRRTERGRTDPQPRNALRKRRRPARPTLPPILPPPRTPPAAPPRKDRRADPRAEAAGRNRTDRRDAAHLCGGRFPHIEATAIREGWTEQQTELEVLRESRPAAPAVHVPDNTVTGKVLEAACMLTAGLEKPEASCTTSRRSTWPRRYHGGIGLQELLLEAAWANGYTGRNFRDSRAVLRFAFGRGVEAAFSTIDIGGILSNVANKFLLEGFFSVERVWRNICAVRNVSDFKTVTSYRLIGKDQYELVAPGGELKHGTLGNEQYTNKADTYGLVLSIDRRDIINDDLGAITTVPRKLGRGSGLKINDVFWTTFLNNAAFFTVGNKNFLSGAATALGIDGLTAAEVAFMDQVDGDGKPIGVMPAILLVPTALSAHRFAALQVARTARHDGRTTKFPVANPHQGKFRVEVSRYLANASYTGNSAKAWYLLSDPNDLPVIEVAFLNGQESPRSKRPRPTSTCSACRCGATTISASRCKTRAAA